MSLFRRNYGNNDLQRRALKILKMKNPKLIAKDDSFQIIPNSVIESEIKKLEILLKKLPKKIEKFLCRKKFPETSLIDRFNLVNASSLTLLGKHLKKYITQLRYFEEKKSSYEKVVTTEVILKLKDLESLISLVSSEIKKIKQEVNNQKASKNSDHDSNQDLRNFDKAVDHYNKALYTAMEAKAKIFETLEYFFSLMIDHYGIMSAVDRGNSIETTKEVFGVSLIELAERTGSSLSHVIVNLCSLLSTHDIMSSEGIFRINGSDRKIKLYRLQINCGYYDEPQNGFDKNSLAGTLKCYLNELPESLLGYSLCDQYKRILTIVDEKEKMNRLVNIMRDIPEILFDNLLYFLIFLNKIKKMSSINKMNCHNLAIVFSPGLLHQNSEQGFNASNYELGIHLIEFMLQNFRKIRKYDIFVKSAERIAFELKNFLKPN